MTQVQDVTPQTFGQSVLGADLPVVLEIWGDDCVICEALAPILDDLAAEVAGRVQVMRLWAQPDMPIIQRYGIRGIPTLLLFVDGQVVARVTGMQQKRDLMDLIEAHT